MKNTELNRHEVEKTLNLLDNAELLPPDPYFYTRLKARIGATKQRGGIMRKILSPAFFTMLIAINVGTTVWYYSGNTTQTMNGQEQFSNILATDLQLENNQSGLLSLK